MNVLRSGIWLWSSDIKTLGLSLYISAIPSANFQYCLHVFHLTSTTAYFFFLYLAICPPTDIHSLKSRLGFIRKSWYDFEGSHGVFHNLYGIRCFWRALQMKKLHISYLRSLNNAVNINPWFFPYEIRKLVYSLNSMHKALKLFEKRLLQTKKVSISQIKK